MRLSGYALAAAVAATLIGAGALAAASPADAAMRERASASPTADVVSQGKLGSPSEVSSQRVRRSQHTRRVVTTRSRRAPTRFTVRRERSYLDPGTEVLPRSQSYTDYALPPLRTPTSDYDPSQSRRYPLPDSYYLPGYVR